MIDYRKEFLKCLGSIDQSKRRYDIFKDFLELSTISFSGILNKNDEDENRYKDIIQQYKHPEKLSELLLITVMALTQKTQIFWVKFICLENLEIKVRVNFLLHSIFQNLWRILRSMKLI